MKPLSFPLAGKALLPLAISALLLGCGDSGGSGSSDYRLSGTLSGLVEGSQVTLRDTEAGSRLSELVLTENGSFTFEGGLKVNDRYLIEVSATTNPPQPSEYAVQWQSCAITDGADGDATGETTSLTGLQVECASQFVYRDNYNTLYASDGTDVGTEMLKTFSGSVDVFVAMGSRLYFVANDGGTGKELWVTDGTEAGTRLVKDIYPGFGGSNPDYLTPLGDRLYFAADDGETGGELWVTDGTEAGTGRVKDIYPGSSGSNPEYLTLLGDRLYFTADDGEKGRELWVTDGTEAGTHRVKDINENGDSDPYDLTPLGDRLYFTADDGEKSQELWVTDGTEAGTRLVKDIYPGSSGSYPYDLTPLGDRLYFGADDGETGYELWVTDGTEAGTHRVKDINKNSDSNPEYLTPLDDRLYFVANDGVSGRALWVTDGTESGTLPVTLPNGDRLLSFYDSPQAAGSQIFVYAAASSNSSNRTTYLITDDAMQPLTAVDDESFYVMSVVGRSSEGVYLFGRSGDYMKGLWFLPNGETQVEAVNVKPDIL